MFRLKGLFVLLLGALCITAVPAHATNLVVNGNFNADTASWTMYNTTSSDTGLVDSFVGTAGYPGGAARLQRSNGSTATNGHRYYQWVPVVPGTKYYVRAQWKGDMAAGATGSSWVDMYVGFMADPNIAGVSWTSRYRKSWDGTNNVNVGSSGAWNWENVTTSPNGTPPDSYTAQTGQNYMIIAFNLGGGVMTPGSAVPYVYIDNVYVVPCTNWLVSDINMDCKVNLVDLALFVNQWLVCNVDPVTSCW
jgi:hypothetical protein